MKHFILLVSLVLFTACSPTIEPVISPEPIIVQPTIEVIEPIIEKVEPVKPVFTGPKSFSMPTGKKTLAPKGFYDFCKRRPEECE